MSDKYPPNSRVDVCITQQVGAGLLGFVDDRQRALIRNREVAWDAPESLEPYIGQTCEAVVLGLNPAYNQLVLSLRLAQRDPWPEAIITYTVGTEAKGRVVGLIEAGAFIEIQPGIDGFLPTSDLRDHTTGRIGEWLWVGDHVKTIVTEVQTWRRRLCLSMGDLLTHREAQFRRRIWHGTHTEPASCIAVARSVSADVWLRLMQLGVDYESSTPEEPLEVLLIEDDRVYAEGLRSFFMQNGCQVTVASDGPTGLDRARCQTSPFHLIVLDWNLPGPKGHEVVEHLQMQHCSSRLVMLLEWTPLQEKPEIWDSLRQSDIDVFFKAEGDKCMEGLVSILRELREDRNHAQGVHRRYFPRSVLPTRVDSVASSADPVTSAVPLMGVTDILAQLKDNTEASAVLLMRLEPEQAGLQVEGCVGAGDAFRLLPPDLIHSPLADVLVRRREVAERVPPGAPKFRRLLDLIDFVDFLGVPVPGDQSVQYGLILLKDQGTFNRLQIQKTRLAAYLIAGVLQQLRITDALERWQPQSLLGQVASGVIHEVTNTLGGLELQIKTIQNGLRQLTEYPPAGGDPTWLHGMHQAVTELAEAHRQASGLRNRYLGLVASDAAESADLNSLAEETIDMLTPEAQQCNVLLEIEITTGLPKVRARPGQLRQILLNLGLNAIQQMATIGRHGIVKIETSYIPDVPRRVQVRFIDDGPGIHACLWNRVFEFGFTTKKDGAGLGLTICQQLAIRLGGTLQVEASHMLWGTTFLLELPEG